MSKFISRQYAFYEKDGFQGSLKHLRSCLPHPFHKIGDHRQMKNRFARLNVSWFSDSKGTSVDKGKARGKD